MVGKHLKKLEPHMLYCYNRDTDDTTSPLYYLYMVDSNTAFLFPHFRMLDVTDGEVLRIINSKTCNFRVDNLRLTSKYPCDMHPCAIYQDGEYKCIGLVTPYRIFPLYPDILSSMETVRCMHVPPFVKGGTYKNTDTGKRYEYVSQNGLDWDELLFKDCDTQDIEIFQGDELIAFEKSESE